MTLCFMAILAIWTQGSDGCAPAAVRTMSDEELKSELERLRNENAALKKGLCAYVVIQANGPTQQ
jgi:hypothetical protein